MPQLMSTYRLSCNQKIYQPMDLRLIRLHGIHFYRTRRARAIIGARIHSPPRRNSLVDRICLWVGRARRRRAAFQRHATLSRACFFLALARRRSLRVEAAAKILREDGAENDAQCRHARAENGNVAFEYRPVDCRCVVIYSRFGN